MYITKHGEHCIMEKVGINKSSVSRHVINVIKKGYSIDEAPKPMEFWLRCKIRYFDEEGINVRVFGNYVYIFGKYNQLITVILIPTSVRQNVQRLNKRKEHHCYNLEDVYYDYSEYDTDDDYDKEGWIN